jgi:hypothetical protein
MDYNKKRHIQLSQRSQHLTNHGKNILIENLEEALELSKYNIVVEEQIFLTRRKDFVLLMKNFIDNIIDFEEFEIAFSLLWRETINESNAVQLNLKQIEEFQPSPTRPYRFASLVTAIFRQFEEVENEYCTERDVKDSVKEIYLESQIFEE